MGTLGDSYPLISVPTPGAGSLVAGAQHWLLAEGAFETFAGWNRVTGDLIGPVAVGGEKGFEYSDGILAAFEVSVVPAPGAWLVLGGAACVCTGRRRARA
jgi:hypothetical protein